jgi:hypothetical protein
MACYVDCTCPWCQETFEGIPPDVDQVYWYVSEAHEPCAICGDITLEKLGGAAAVLELCDAAIDCRI